MKGRPQIRTTPFLGVFFVSPSSSSWRHILSALAHCTQGESKDSHIPGWLEALARLLGFPVAQPVPVRACR